MSVRDSKLHKVPLTGKTINVLVVDDSSLAQAVLTRILNHHPDIEVTSVANSADEAITILKKQKFDIIILDIEMPVRTGLDILPEIINVSSNTRILVVSSQAEENGEVALKALELGACDTLVKPGKTRFSGEFSKNLVDKVVYLGHSTKSKSRSFAQQSKTDKKIKMDVLPSAIAIGSSTGGIPAIYEFISKLSDHVSAPIFITQHLPANFINFFAKQLESCTKRDVHIAEDGMVIKPNSVYVAPGDYHLGCSPRNNEPRIKILKNTADDRYCPSVDRMLEALGNHYEGDLLIILLSGMGNDGSAACAQLVEKGSKIFVQDEESSVVWGMPGAVARLSLGASILKVEDMVLNLNKMKAVA